MMLISKPPSFYDEARARRIAKELTDSDDEWTYVATACGQGSPWWKVEIFEGTTLIGTWSSG